MSRLAHPIRTRLRPTGPAGTPTVETAESFSPTPIYIGQRTRILLLVAIVIILVFLATQAPSVPRLLAIGATVSLILSFPVRLLQRWMPRGLAILVVVASTIAFAIIGLILIVPFAIREISGFVTQLPQTLSSVESLLRDVLVELNHRGWIDRDPDELIREIRGNLLNRAEDMTESALNGALATLARSFSLAINTFGVIFIATYLLIDIPRFREKFVLSFSPVYRPDAAQLWSTIGESLSRYLGGLSVSILIQGSMATVGLAFLDVPYAVVLGLWMSATAILPYVGAFLGAIPAVLIALTISWEKAVVVVILYVVINQVEGNLITPRVQGSAVRVHPLVIFISVIGGAEMAGGLGAILAVPTLAVLRVLAEFLWVRLRVRQAQDTVLVALGGDDDDGELPDETRISVTTEHDTQITVDTLNDADVSISRTSGDVAIHTREESRQPIVATVYRPRPTTRKRVVTRRLPG